jgi:peptide deformylase
MTILKIAQLGEPVLRQVARELRPDEIGSEDVQRLIEDMIDTMRDADGAGLAAPQVYRAVSLCILEVRDGRRYPGMPVLPLTVLLNPVVEALTADPLSEGDGVAMYEGCLSVPGLRGRVRRPRRVRVRALDRAGLPVELRFDGPLASVVQHETDHLRGVLFVDRVDPRTLTFLREYERHVPPTERLRDECG